MNTANLQLEGFYLVIAALNNALVAKGVMSREEIDAALNLAEVTAVNDYGLEEISPANRDAVAFPARLLRLANNWPLRRKSNPSQNSQSWSARPKSPTMTSGSLLR